jgi:hypothetical protein
MGAAVLFPPKYIPLWPWLLNRVVPRINPATKKHSKEEKTTVCVCVLCHTVLVWLLCSMYEYWLSGRSPWLSWQLWSNALLSLLIFFHHYYSTHTVIKKTWKKVWLLTLFFFSVLFRVWLIHCFWWCFLFCCCNGHLWSRCFFFTCYLISKSHSIVIARWGSCSGMYKLF